MSEVATGPGWELRLGRWQDVLRDYTVTDPPYSSEVHSRHAGTIGSVVTDPPYSSVAHNGHNSPVVLSSQETRSAIEYAPIDASDIAQLVGAFAPANWFCCLCDTAIIPDYQAAYRVVGLTAFAPVPCVTRGMTVRLAGDGPSSWAVYLMVARTKAAHKWGTLDGAYTGLPQGERMIAGSKSLVLMRKIVRDYSRPGDLVCDPYAGSGTTLLAAVIEGRRAIGAEMDRGRFDMAVRRLREGHTPDMFSDEVSDGIHN